MNANARQGERAAGYAYGASAYLLWGLMPLYFTLLLAIDPFEIVAARISLALVFCALLLCVTRQWGAVARVLRDRSLLVRLSLAACVIYVNWQVYVIAATTGHVLDASLGYFLNPVVTVVFAVLFRGERLSALQWIAMALTVTAFCVIAVGYGVFPWAALLLALSFAAYGLIKQGGAAAVPALPGLFIESLVLLPVSLVIIGVLAATQGLSALRADGGTLALLLCAGATTAIPLLFFSAAARRMSLVALGLLQYIGPVLIFVSGWLVLGEQIPPARWAGFALVWVAIVLLVVHSLRGRRRRPIEPV